MILDRYPEIMGGLQEAVRRQPSRRRYHRAVLRRLKEGIDSKKAMYKGRAHYVLLLNAITRGS